MTEGQKTEMFATEAALHAKAESFLRENEILELLRPYGELLLEGSYVYGTMVDHDVDIRIILPTGRPNKRTRNQLMAAILELQGLIKIKMVDLTEKTDTEHSHDPGIWFGPQILYEGDLWNIDIWLYDQKYGKMHLDVYEKMQKISDEQRAIILNIKQYCLENGFKKKGYTSTDIYQAVLGESITTPEQYLQSRGQI